MSDRAKKAKAAAMRKYRETHRDELNAYRRKWAKANPDKVKQQQENYYNNKAIEAEMEQDQSSITKAWERQKEELPAHN